MGSALIHMVVRAHVDQASLLAGAVVVARQHVVAAAVVAPGVAIKKKRKLRHETFH